MNRLSPTLFAAAVLAAPLASQDPAAKVDFVAQIQPILKARCYKCHGPDEQDGDLRLDLRAGVVDNDVDTVVSGSADDSVLVELISLDADDPDIMPNEGDPLTAEQIALIRRWIDEGADWPAEADAEALAIEAKRKANRIDLAELDEAQRAACAAAAEAVRARGALAMTIAQDSAAIDANFSLLGANAGDDAIAALRGLEPVLVWLNLARTAVTDDGVAALAGFAELRRLNLANTAVTDRALDAIAGLERLQYLNLYGTRVTDAGLERLRGLPALRKLFLWQTAVTADGAAALRAAMPGVEVDLGDYATELAAVAERIAAEKAAAQPVNAECPVSGKPASAEFTVSRDDALIGFCCAKCLAAFQKNPDEYLPKLAALLRKPVNDTCPVSGKPVDPSVTFEHDGRLVAFCCTKCCAAFQQDPAKYAAKLPAEPPQPEAGKRPVNDTCPVSGKPVDPSVTFEHDGRLVAFCCTKCCAAFRQDPAEYAAKIGGKQDR